MLFVGSCVMLPWWVKVEPEIISSFMSKLRIFSFVICSTNAKIFLASKSEDYFKVSEGEKVAFIGSANLYVTELTE